MIIKFFFAKKNRNFLKLFVAQLFSQFGDRVNQMALIKLIFEMTGKASAMGLAKLISFTIIPVFVIGPFAGVFVDRWSRRKTLYGCDFLRTVFILTIPFFFIKLGSLVPIYLVVFSVFALSRFYVPAKMALIPDLVEKEDLLLTNSLLTTTGMIAFVLGASIGGIAVEHLGSSFGFSMGGVAFFISAVLIFTMTKQKKKEHRPLKEIISKEISIWHDIRDGFKYLINHKELRFIINITFTLLAASGAIYIVFIVFIQEAFKTVTQDLGIIAVAMGVGLFIGAILYGKWGTKFVWYRTIFFCLIFAGLLVNVFAIFVSQHPNLTFACLMAAVLGMVLGPIFIASNTVAHIVSDEKMRGKVFTALEIVIHFAFLLTMLISSFISEFVEPVWILVTVGCIIALVGLVGLLKFKSGVDLVNGQQNMA